VSEEFILSEIIQGYTPIEWEGITYYFKHPSVAKKLSEEPRIALVEKEAEDLGILSESELLDSAIENNLWSEEKEEEIKVLKWEIGKKKAQKFQDPHYIESNKASIKRSEDELNILIKERESFTNYSSEHYSMLYGPISFCKEDVYLDKGFLNNVDEKLGKDLFEPYISQYNRLYNQDSLLRAAYNHSFFDLIFLTSEGSPMDIFGKTIYELTIFQKMLLIYGKVLNSKLKNYEVPDKFKKDAISLYNYDPDKDKKEDGRKVKNFRKEMIENRGGLDNISAKDKIT